MGSKLSFSVFAHCRSMLAECGTEEHPFHPLNERLPLPNYKVTSDLETLRMLKIRPL